LTDHEMTELLYGALHSAQGTVVSTNSADKLRQKLYALRKKLNDEDLAQLSLTISPTNPATDLWIIKTGATSHE
jgi:hypothetical protein